MAITKKNQNNRKVAGYEAKLVNALEAAVAVGLSADNMSDHMYLYDDLCIAAYNFIEKIALSKYRKRLEGRGIHSEEIANLVTEELFWRKLDYIMNSNDPVNCRGLINNTVAFRVKDLISSDKRAQNDVPVIVFDGNEVCETADDTTYSKANVHFTDVGWNLVASNTNLEEEAIAHDECLAILDALKRNTNLFEVVAFLGTKLIRHKASELAADLLVHGKQTVYFDILQQTIALFQLDYSFFADAAFEIDSAELKHSDIKKLSAQISHCSDRAKNKVRKVLSKSK